MEETLGLAQRQAQEQAERECRLNGNIGIHWLGATLAGLERCPGIDGVLTDLVWSNYSNVPIRQQLYTTPCAFLVLHSTVPCLIFTVSMRETRGGGTAVWIGRRYWRTSRDQSTKHSSYVTNTW